ncbi:hypothetical protein ASF41_22050 [Methylobacterium sp. Leaf111]|nr:hypothetical protein ASF41_22050 [Methylobacterium sp. Leaf111]
MLNQDGGLAVRVQAEDASGNLTGPISRYDDEGTTFLAGTQGITFDVRDLVSGAARGDTFEGVVQGTSGADALTFFPPFRGGQNFYYNAGMGDDVVAAGEGNDFLVGGGGNDQLSGNGGNDSFIGGGGSDSIFGGAGNDTVIANVSTDGADTVNLGDGSDVVTVNSATPGQVRLTFTSGQVGNGNPSDSNTMANQDGGLAVRLQAEDGSGNLSGPISRYDDEGITFTAGAGVTFDVRDLVSGAERGDQFEVVTLGTSANDTLTAVQGDRSYYFNAGMGDDIVTGGTANDFLVGGAGNDTLSGGLGSDIFIGGGGSDALIGGAGRDTASYATSLSSVSADLLTPSVNQGDAAGDTYDSIENLLGSAFNDQLRGDDRNNVLDGGAGNDRLYGRLGEDKLNGGAGDDFLAGGNGVDFLNGGEGNDELFGGRGADTLTGGTGNDTFVYRALDEGSDLIRGFNVLDDTISLNASGFGVQDPASVTFISGPAAMATGSSMTLVYDTATSSLSFDSNGADEGGVSQIATFNSNPQLSQADILWV